VIDPFPTAARLDAARAAILEAGALALSYFGRIADLAIETKSNGQDVVSVADREVETLVRRLIGEAFPRDGFLGEEYGLSEGSSGCTWVLDPVDGTSCFVHGLRSWCVSLALVKGREIEAGLIFDPGADELFVAVRGSGATLNGWPIQVDRTTDLKHGLTGLGANFRIPARDVSVFVERLLEAGGMFVRSGSGALSLAYVACGRLAAYYEPHIHAWDCLAGLCLIREAGGWTNDFAADGALVRGGPVIACAPQLRSDLLMLAGAASLPAASVLPAGANPERDETSRLA